MILYTRTLCKHGSAASCVQTLCDTLRAAARALFVCSETESGNRCVSFCLPADVVSPSAGDTLLSLWGEQCWQAAPWTTALQHRRDPDIRLLRSIHYCTCMASCASCNLSLWLSFLTKRLLENTRCSSCSALCAWKNTSSQGCFGVSCSCLNSG